MPIPTPGPTRGDVITAWTDLPLDRRVEVARLVPALALLLDELAGAAEHEAHRRYRGPLVERRSGALPPVGSGRYGPVVVPPLTRAEVEGTAPDRLAFLTQTEPAPITGAAVIDEVLRVTRQLAHEHRRDARDPAAIVVSSDVLEAMRKAAARQTGHPLTGIPKHPTGRLWNLPVEEDATLRPGVIGVRDAAGTFTLVALDEDAALGQAVREHRS